MNEIIMDCSTFGHAAAIRLEPAWMTSDVVAIVRGVAADFDWQQFTYLIDALVDAGLDPFSEELLRSYSRHSGCALELIRAMGRAGFPVFGDPATVVATAVAVGAAG